jgi:hypothetical protein
MGGCVHRLQPPLHHPQREDFCGAPLAEQRAIAEALGDVDALIRSLDQLIAKKRDLKQAAMQQLLTGRQRLPGFAGSWREAQLRRICKMRSGQAITAEDLDDGRGFLLLALAETAFVGHTGRLTHAGEVRASSVDRAPFCGNVAWPAGSSAHRKHGCRLKGERAMRATHFISSEADTLSWTEYLQPIVGVVGSTRLVGRRKLLRLTARAGRPSPPRRAARHRRGPLRSRRRADRPRSPPRQDPGPQAGHDAITAHRPDPAGLTRGVR